MAALPVSIVIVSRGRPGHLIRCLTGIDGLIHPQFEVVVVACAEGCTAVRSAGFDPRVKLGEFGDANISAARNLGIAMAAGDIVAFIDDDAVPEPMWLKNLCRGFDHEEVAAAGGFVRGRNGISFQWRARQVDRCGRAKPLKAEGAGPALPVPDPGHAVKTEGTNMAVRRDVLAALGGFDPGFRFYLDETDLNLRLADAGYRTAIVPRAEVHHAYAASERRSDRRAVTDLFEIGASIHFFLRKHCPEDDRGERLREMMQEQQMRVFDQLKAGLLRKPEVGPLIDGLNRGVAEGGIRPVAGLAPLGAAGRGFLPFTPARSGGTVLAGRIWQARRLRRKAAQLAAQGRNVSLFLFGPSPRYHRLRFDDAGYWEQYGGLFGRSDRQGPFFVPVGFDRRLRNETARVAIQRGLPGGGES